MIITYQGDNYFKIQSGDTSLLIDPTNQRSFKGTSLIVNTIKPSYVDYDGNTEIFWIDHQGEYEIKGISVRGWSAENDGGTEKTIYRITFDEIVISVLGHITSDPANEFFEYLENTDILIAPAGGKPFVSLPSIAKFIRQIEPSVIIPSLFKDIKPFLKEFAKESVPSDEKYVFKKKDLSPNAMEIRKLEEKK